MLPYRVVVALDHDIFSDPGTRKRIVAAVINPRSIVVDADQFPVGMIDGLADEEIFYAEQRIDWRVRIARIAQGFELDQGIDGQRVVARDVEVARYAGEVLEASRRDD